MIVPEAVHVYLWGNKKNPLRSKITISWTKSTLQRKTTMVPKASLSFQAQSASSKKEVLICLLHFLFDPYAFSSWSADYRSADFRGYDNPPRRLSRYARKPCAGLGKDIPLRGMVVNLFPGSEVLHLRCIYQKMISTIKSIRAIPRSGISLSSPAQGLRA